MAAASCLLTEDQFLCSICLDVFTDPVSIPCGHNFCKSCITTHWNVSVQCQCPLCKRIYKTRPELQVNTFICEMAAQFRQSAQHKTSSSEQHVAKPGEVPCDVCTAPKLKALKSCLVCLASYCETHLEPHLTASSLKKHQLIDLEDRMCKKHDKLLELFCETDQMCVCVMCAVLDHKTHDVAPMKQEYKNKKAELGKTDAEIQQMIQKRRLKIEEVKRSMELSNKDADRETAEGVKVFTALKEAVERSQAELINTITEKKRVKINQGAALIKHLEEEISDLKKRSSDVEQLSQSEDWTDVSFLLASYEGSVVRAVSQLENELSDYMAKLFHSELSRVQKYAVNVTLDPDVVHPVRNEHHNRKVCRCVFSDYGFSSGRFYFAVTTSQTFTVGVTRNLTNTGSETTLSPRNGYWTVSMQWKLIGPNKYFAAADQPVCLCLKSKPAKVGVFVDYEQGLVSFHDVNTAALIYCFTGCSFAGNIYPFFSPCDHNGRKIHTSDESCVLQ